MGTAVHRLDALPAPVREGWEALTAQSSVDSPFTEPAFALAAARHLPGRPPPGLLLVEDAGEPVLALPVRRLARGALLASWQHDYCFLSTPQVAAGRERQAWAAALTGLRAAGTRWLDLPDLPAGSPVLAGLLAAAGDTGVHVRSTTSSERATVERRPEPTYLDGRLSGVHRKGLRRLRRRLGGLAGAEVVTVDRTGDPAALEDFLRLEAAGWKGRAGTAMASRPGHAELLREVQRRWGDRLQVLCLQADDRALAVQVNLRAGRTLSCFKTAYDERFAACSPGLLLELDVVAAFHDDARVDLLDSCAVAGHGMAERLFADRRELVRVVLALTPAARATAGSALFVDQQWSRWRRRTMIGA